MSAYSQFHPLAKQASMYEVPTKLVQFLSNNGRRLQQKLRALKKPGAYKNLAKQTYSTFKPEILGGAAGVVPGAVMGNEAFNNSLPPVRELPHVDQSPYIEADQRNAFYNR